MSNQSQTTWPILAIAISIVLILFLAIFLISAKKSSKKEIEPVYRAFFTLGLFFFVLGIGSENSGMWPMGLIFAIIGIANKDKWKRQKKWAEMSKSEQVTFVFIITSLTLALLAGIAVTLLKGG